MAIDSDVEVKISPLIFVGDENKAEKIDIIPKVETHMLNIPKNELRHMETIDFMPQKIFYGVVADTLKQHGGDDLEFDDAVGKLALNMKQAVQSLARVDWRTSTPIHKKMNQAVEDLLWDFCDEFGIDLPIDKMDLLIENAIKTAMSRY